MMLNRRIFNSSMSLSRKISATAFRQLEVPSSKPMNEEKQLEFDESKKKLEWRIKPFERKGEWYSKFKLFMQDDKEAVAENLAVKLQQPISMRPSSVKKWWKQKSEKQERYLQQFIAERHEVLGNDLGSAHFLLFRMGKVRFYGQTKWMQLKDDLDEIKLPNKHDPNYLLEGIDCEGMELYYEGLDNVRRLQYLRFLSFRNLKTFDDWCLDRVSGSEFESLEVLDLSGTSITFRGLQALYRVPTLKKLNLTDPYRDVQWKLTVAMLQDIIPELEIVETKAIFEPLKE